MHDPKKTFVMEQITREEIAERLNISVHSRMLGYDGDIPIVFKNDDVRLTDEFCQRYAHSFQETYKGCLDDDQLPLDLYELDQDFCQELKTEF